MRTLPTGMLHLLNPFVPLFSGRVWPHVQLLLAGAILAPGKRTVSAALRVMGLGQIEHFAAQEDNRVGLAIALGGKAALPAARDRPFSPLPLLSSCLYLPTRPTLTI